MNKTVDNFILLYELTARRVLLTAQNQIRCHGFYLVFTPGTIPQYAWFHLEYLKIIFLAQLHIKLIGFIVIDNRRKRERTTGK